MLTPFDMGLGIENVSDHDAETLLSEKLKLCDF